MEISKNLTQQKLLEILVTSYIRGQEKENIQMLDFIEEIKQEFLVVINTRDDNKNY